MKKKITVVATAVALAALLAVGGTLAWFTSQDTATNTFAMGNLKVAAYETGEKDGQPTPVKTLDFKNVMPGNVEAKDPYFVNEGTENALVRAKVTIEATKGVTEANKTKVEAALAAITMDYNTTNFTKGSDGLYYYNGILAKDAATEKLFNTVTIPGTAWDNDMQGVEFSITIDMDAIQSENVYDETDFTEGALVPADLIQAWANATTTVTPVE